MLLVWISNVTACVLYFLWQSYLLQLKIPSVKVHTPSPLPSSFQSLSSFRISVQNNPSLFNIIPSLLQPLLFKIWPHHPRSSHNLYRFPPFYRESYNLWMLPTSTNRFSICNYSLWLFKIKQKLRYLQSKVLSAELRVTWFFPVPWGSSCSHWYFWQLTCISLFKTFI